MILLKTKRLIIRDHKPQDLESMHQLLSNEEAMYYIQDIKTNTIEETAENLNIAIAEAQQENRTKYFFRIEDASTQEYIGEIGFTVTLSTPLGNVANLGYFVLPKHWGKGITTEATKEVLRYAFEEASIVKIETGCIKNNTSSEAIMKKLGMIKEAEYKMRVWHDNAFKDRVEYRLLKEEWSRNYLN